MKDAIKKIKQAVEILSQKVQEREDYVLNRSEKWQESEKCEEYEDKTNEMESIKDCVEGYIEELEDLS